MTDTLPPAADRWLTRAVPGRKAAATQAAVWQSGELETQGRWLSFSAHATYRARPLAFEWRARLRLLPGIWVDAVDGHAKGDGWGGAKLWGIRSMGQRSGPDVYAVQLIRHIAELAWVPQLATADPGLSWGGDGPDRFTIRADAADRGVEVAFEVDATGDVVAASSPERPYDVPDGYDVAPWRVEFSQHDELGGTRIPTYAVATYELPDGPWEYFRATVTEVEVTP